MAERTERALLAGLLVALVAVRAIHLGQPIVENYVGRQVPTAMVARHLERGVSFLRPELDTAPHPNLFLVEPPIYAAAAVGLSRATGRELEPAGRLVSSLGVALAGWGLFGLVRRRHGPAAALLAVAAFGAFPLTIRYGRAFQPDALMLGLMIAGLHCWDRRASGGGRAWSAAGIALLSTGLAMKITAAYLLVPLGLVVLRDRPRRSLAWLPLLALPALLWYGHAAFVMSGGEGSRATADSGGIWLRALLPTTLLDPAFHRLAARYVLIRGFTPLGFALAAWGLWRSRSRDGLWRVWLGSAAAMLGGLAAKAHHEYYWLALAPVAAAGVGVGLVELARRGRVGRTAAFVAGSALMVLGPLQAASTFAVPPEWSALPVAASAVARHVPRGEWVVAPEALIYAADRRGCRLEVAQAAQRRAIGEWGGAIEADDPLELVEFYRARGARYVADLTTVVEPRRAALHDAIRRRYTILVDRDGVLLARLADPGGDPDAPR